MISGCSQHCLSHPALLVRPFDFRPPPKNSARLAVRSQRGPGSGLPPRSGFEKKQGSAGAINTNSLPRNRSETKTPLSALSSPVPSTSSPPPRAAAIRHPS
uniref:Uncharacterized protein n=1 Tax=Arundo donax TaxID=35708 RepID=A0A0A9DAY9_ARUDO